MKNQTRFLAVAAVAVILLAGAAQFILRGQKSVNLTNLPVNNVFKPEEVAISPTPLTIKTESVLVDFGNGRKIKGEVATQSAYQALVITAKKNDMEVEAKEYKYGMRVTKIGDTANSSDHYWTYSVNGKPGQIAADRYVIHPGDKVEWVYKKVQN